MAKFSLDLKSKIIIVFLTGMAFILLIVASLSAWTLVSWNKESELSRLRQVSIVQKNRIDDLQNKKIELLRSFSSNPALKDALEDYYGNNTVNALKELNKILLESRLASENIKDIYLVDKNGNYILGTSGNDFSSDELMMIFEGGKNQEHLHFIKESPKPKLIVHGPIKRGSKLLGVMVVKMGSEDVEEIATDYSVLGKTGETIIAHWKDEDKEIAELLYPRRFENVASDYEITAANSSLIIDALKGVSYTGTEYTDYRGKRVYFSTQKSEQFDWGIVVKQDYDEIIAPVNKYMWSLTVSIVISSIVVFIIAFYFSSNLKKGLGHLYKGIRILESGDLDYKIKVDSMDELGLLAQSFNNLAYNLKKAREDVDKKVKQQTKAIEAQQQKLENQQLAIMNILDDIEEEKEKLEQTASDLKKFQLAVERASDGIIITDKDGIVLYANDAIERITGFSKNEIIGKKAGTKELWGGLMSQEFYRKMWQTIKKDKKTFFGEIHNRRKSGEDYISAINLYPILDKNNEVAFFVSVERDITKEKAVDRVKTEFVSLASHQLRTPLSAINWYAEMLLNGDAGKINEEQKKYLYEIYRGNQRMVELVNSLLNVSRLELGTFEINPEQVDLVKLTKEVLKELEPSIFIKHHSIEERFSKKIPKAKVDRGLMRMIIQNLLSNAVKYTPNRGTITVSISYNSRGHRISVSDNGYGIPKEQQNKIFTKLFRADNVRSLDTEGTGLGLYIVKAILDHSGGSIKFKSAENKGTTFTVTIPKSGMKQKEGTKKLS